MARLSRHRTQPTFGTRASAQRRLSRRTGRPVRRRSGSPRAGRPCARSAAGGCGRRSCARPGRDRAGPAAGRSGCRRPATGAPPGPRSVADTARRSSGRTCGRRCRRSWPAPAPGSSRTGPGRSARATPSPAPASGTGGTGPPAQSLGRVRQSGGPGIPPRPERRGFQPGLSVNTAAPQLPSSALFTDQYELTMLEGALRSGTAGMRAIFEVHARRLLNGRRYGVVAGTGRLLEALERFRFGPSELEHLTAAKIVDEATCEWLSTYRFRCDIDGYAEGDVYL